MMAPLRDTLRLLSKSRPLLHGAALALLLTRQPSTEAAPVTEPAA